MIVTFEIVWQYFANYYALVVYGSIEITNFSLEE